MEKLMERAISAGKHDKGRQAECTARGNLCDSKEESLNVPNKKK